MTFGVFRKAVSVVRVSNGAWVGGVWVPGAPVSGVTVQASVQPSSQDDLQLLPEGARLDGSVTLYTNDALQIAEEGSNEISDRIVHDGSEYKVMAKAVWDNGLIPHNRYVCVRVNT